MAPPTPAVGRNAILEFVRDTGDAHKITALDTAITTVEFGLWNNAYDRLGSVLTGPDINLDFISTDSGRFFFRVLDQAASGRGSVKIEWRTLNHGKGPLDAPADATLTLTEIEPGVFTSAAVMLVSESVDADTMTSSQLKPPAVAPVPDVRSRGTSDHRLRVGSMSGFVEARYPAASTDQVIATVPVFEGKRRILNVQVFVIQNAWTDAEFAAVTPRIGDNLLRKVTGVYERLGIWFFAGKAPGKAFLTLGREIPYDVMQLTVPTVGPDAVANPALLTQAEMTRIANQNPAIGLQARLFFVRGLASGHGGDTFAPNNQPPTDLNYTSWVVVDNFPYSAAHELGHSLTQTAGVGQGHYAKPTAPPGNRLIEGRHLMAAAHPSLLTPPLPGENTRVWDVADGHGYNQYQAIRTCRLTGPMP